MSYHIILYHIYHEVIKVGLICDTGQQVAQLHDRYMMMMIICDISQTINISMHFNLSFKVMYKH